MGNNINNKKAKSSTTFAGTREFRGFRRATSGSGGDHSPGSAASLPAASHPVLRHRLWFFGRRETKIVVVVVVVVVVVAVVKLRFFYFAVVNVMYEKLILSELSLIISIYIHSTYE